MLHETDLSRLDLNLLTLFDAVRREGHVGRAADRLNLSPSAVSHGLARLRRMFDDPLFLRMPKGVAMTARAEELAPQVAEILSRIRAVMVSATPFDPRQSNRRFVIGAPDGVAAVILPPLLRALTIAAPKIDLALRQLLPDPGETQPESAWRGALADLDSRTLDIAILPVAPDGARFAVRPLYVEDFVIVVPKGHPFAADPTAEHYFRLGHVLVSEKGDAQGFVDQAAGATTLRRRIALTVPNFMMALASASETGLAAAVPRRFAALHAARFGLVAVEAPLDLPKFSLCAALPEVALADRGTAWLLETLVAAASAKS
ncbi:MAG: LysR family transcriptional regulator [Tabrizicola sp.]|nr:LysR family transcriptional regulator [Tabrizicola sp.]